MIAHFVQAGYLLEALQSTTTSRPLSATADRASPGLSEFIP